MNKVNAEVEWSKLLFCYFDDIITANICVHGMLRYPSVTTRVANPGKFRLD